MKKNQLIILCVFLIVVAAFTSCKKDVAKLEKADLVGAWETEVSDTESRMMVFMETNDIYPEAGTTDAVIIFIVTDTDTTFGFQGSYNVIDGNLITMSGSSTFSNEILEFTNKKLTLYTETTDDFQRVWSKVDTDWLTDNPLD